MEALTIGRQFIDAGHPVTRVLKILNISKSSYYYEPKRNPLSRGIARSEFTRVAGGQFVSNEQVVKDIEQLLAHEFVDYGYLKTTYWLRKAKKYIINEKKVYRLMRENNLLNSPTKNAVIGKKAWIKDFVPKPSKSLEYFEMDIKYIYIHKLRRNALLLSVIDVESRWLIGQAMSWNIRQQEVVKLFDTIFQTYHLPKRMFIRNDNGSQFIAKAVQDYFEYQKVTQEYTKPATPEQNAHIESYHSILERVICKRFQFETIVDARSTMERFVTFYNYERIHSGIDYQSPYEYLNSKGIDMIKPLKLNTFNESSKAEAGNAGEQPVRNNLTCRINSETAPPGQSLLKKEDKLIHQLSLTKPIDELVSISNKDLIERSVF